MATKDIITISYINFWLSTGEIQDRWLSEFIKHNIHKDVIEIDPINNPDIIISSCFGNINNIDKYSATIKIFYYGENPNNISPYNNFDLLKTKFDIIVGFKYTDKKNKIYRLPLWLIGYPYYKYEQDDNVLNYLQNKCNENLKLHKSDCSLVCRHDMRGQRTILYNEMKKYINILCPGNFKRNVNPIGNGCNAKINFIKNTIYNICPENSCYEGYFTEKIFQALEAGCIPIYWAIDLPEKNILNECCYCFVDINDKSNIEKQIYDVINNRSSYNLNNLFKTDASIIINTYYTDLKDIILEKLAEKEILCNMAPVAYG